MSSLKTRLLSSLALVLFASGVEARTLTRADGSKTYGALTVDKRIGPELGIGHGLGHYHDEVVLLIKGDCGNRSLGWNFMPPSSRKRLGKPMTEAEGWYAGTSDDRYGKHAKAVLENLEDNDRMGGAMAKLLQGE